jgi:glycolate oxidase FAD binding subunit
MALSGATSFAGVAAREGLPADDVQGVRPSVVVSPSSAESVAAVLGEAARARASVVIRGGGTRLEWGRPPHPIDVLLDLSGLNRVIAHEHGDLTATVEGGAAVTTLNAALSRHQQWLPIDVADDRATIGGTIATGDSGPLRHRYGTARDLVIGVTLATTDGALVHAGGRVVKNVAGYDLGKLMSGSLGSFAAIVSATFKLSPLLPHSATLRVRGLSAEEAVLGLRRLASSQLEPAAVDIRGHWAAAEADGSTTELLVRFASTARSVETQLRRLRDFVPGGLAAEIAGAEESTCWRAQMSGPWASAGAIVRLSWPSADLTRVLGSLADLASNVGVAIELTGRAGVGAGLLRVEGAADQQRRVIEALRTASPRLGAVSLLRGSADLKRLVDVWGDVGSSVGVLQALKRAFDPTGVLGAGRGVV